MARPGELRPVRRAGTLAAVLTACAVSTACGSSVVDSDSRAPSRSAAPAADPFCTAAAANAEAIRPLNGLIARGAAPSDLTSTVDAARRSGAALLVAAPGDIRVDVERTVAAVDQQLDALVANGGDGAALRRDRELAATLNSPELAASVERVTRYVSRTCGPAGSR